MAAAAALAASPFDQQSSSQPTSTPALVPGLPYGAEGALAQATSQPQPSGLPLPAWQNEGVLMGSCSLPGTRYGKLNQDYVLTQVLHSGPGKQQRHHSGGSVPQCYMAAVLLPLQDGHGMLGEYAAREGGTRIMHALKHSQLLRRKLQDFSEQEMTELLTQVFLEGHKGALQAFHDAPPRYSFPLGSRLEQQYALQYIKGSGDKCYTNPYIGSRLVEFGTSATLALVQGHRLVVADVGDSLAVLGREEGDEYVGDIVSVRHFGWDEGERQRLKEQCGDSVSIAGEDGYLTVEEGRLRGFQLAMTRALGHRLLANYGVIPEPSVTFHQLKPEHVCLIVATDGVWEVLSPSEAVKIVCDHLAEGYSASAAAAELCREAVRLASSVQHAGEAAQADNTTAAVLAFPEL